MARLFGLAELDDDTGEPDPERVAIWGMEVEDKAVLYWHDELGRSQFAVFESAQRAEYRFGRRFALGLVWP